eukprot:gb/GFBE01001980.1/.p1 GENE.gb/GFBE01001980.1/~~gb/GFBE01001980.1/.p1  ORF type:complete len:154 (+),score=31.67 gb/GFBE01001980.1/:1-462(+)
MTADAVSDASAVAAATGADASPSAGYSSADAPPDASPARKDPLVMYVLVRRDLEWPVGALMNQVSHATAAVAWEAREDVQAAEYFNEVEGQMTTMTMGASEEAELRKVAQKLETAGFPFRLWVEQPEGVASALATWPRRRSEIQKCFKGIKRF